MRKDSNTYFRSVNKDAIAIRNALNKFVSKHGDREVYESMAMLLRIACKSTRIYINVCNGSSKKKNLADIADCIKMLNASMVAIKKGKECSFDNLTGPDWETCDRLKELILLSTPTALEEGQFKDLKITLELLVTLSKCYDWKTLYYK